MKRLIVFSDGQHFVAPPAFPPQLIEDIMGEDRYLVFPGEFLDSEIIGLTPKGKDPVKYEPNPGLERGDDGIVHIRSVSGVRRALRADSVLINSQFASYGGPKSPHLHVYLVKGRQMGKIHHIPAKSVQFFEVMQDGNVRKI